MVALWPFSARPSASPGPNTSSDPPVPSTTATTTATCSAPPPSSPASAQTLSSPSLTDEELIRRFLTPDPQRTGYDPCLPWWHNYVRMLRGRITPEGVEQFREDQYRVHEARDLAKAEKWRDWLLEYSPIVRFLRERVADLGGVLDETNIICRRCPGRPVVVRHRDPDTGLETGEASVAMARQAGGFSPDHGIVVCSNAIRDRGHLEDVLAHEMVHAWDHLRWQVNFGGQVDLKHAACTEIRASMLSGECRWSREFFDRGNWSLTQEFQKCVRRRAVESVMARPSCKDDSHAVRVVNQVWDSCYADKRPFNDVFK